jgi:hypothetical protein
MASNTGHEHQSHGKGLKSREFLRIERHV